MPTDDERPEGGLVHESPMALEVTPATIRVSLSSPKSSGTLASKLLYNIDIHLKKRFWLDDLYRLSSSLNSRSQLGPNANDLVPVGCVLKGVGHLHE